GDTAGVSSSDLRFDEVYAPSTVDSSAGALLAAVHQMMEPSHPSDQSNDREETRFLGRFYEPDSCARFNCRFTRGLRDRTGATKAEFASDAAAGCSRGADRARASP